MVRQIYPSYLQERIVHCLRSVYLFKRLAGFQQNVFLAPRYFLILKVRMGISGILAKIAGGVIYSCGRGLGIGQ
jgi:hypothetical protein